MTFHRRNVSIASSNRTATPTDSWESYFDSWSSEDHEAPDDIPPPSAPAIVEPIIVDNDLYHTESLLSANFNLDHALDFDLDWELDHHYREYQSRCSPNAFGRLNDDNPASKRQAIFMSKLHSPDRVPRGQGQGQGHTDTVRPIHQSRRDRRPAPVRRRVDDVDVRATEMAKPTSQPCVAAEWRGSETETTRSNDAASTLQVRSLVPDQHQRQSTIPSTTSSTAARYGERNPGRSRGPAKAGLGSARPLDPLDPPVSLPLWCLLLGMISSWLPLLSLSLWNSRAAFLHTCAALLRPWSEPSSLFPASACIHRISISLTLDFLSLTLFIPSHLIPPRYTSFLMPVSLYLAVLGLTSALHQSLTPTGNWHLT